MQIFDTHTHLNVEEFAGKEQEELNLAKEMGLVAHNIVGFDKPTISRLVGILRRRAIIVLKWKPIFLKN